MSAPRASATGSGSVSLTRLGTPVTENFDSLAWTGSSSSILPAGWYFHESGISANTTYSIGTGSRTTGDTYSFGITGTNPITDRALGILRSGSLSSTIGAVFTNNTGGIITSLLITYTGEMWRAGVTNRNAADRLAFQYSTDAITLTNGTWIDFDALNYTSTVISTTSGAKDGNSPSFRTVVSSILPNLNLANGSSFAIRWLDFDIAGSDDALAIDDFVITPLGIADVAPTVTGTSPSPGATSVAVNSSIEITFSEPVNVTGSWYVIQASSSGSHAATVTGGPTTYTLQPNIDFSNNETITVTVIAAQIADQDVIDPPDNMAADYIWSFTTRDSAPSVSSVHPSSNSSNVAISSDIVITFNEPVNVTGVWFAIQGSSSGAHAAAVTGGPSAFILNPASEFANGETVNVTIFASQVTDQDSNDPPDSLASDYTWAFGTIQTQYRIHAIQGPGHISPYSGTAVATYPAIVTAKRSNGFYLQEMDANTDGDEKTSEAVFVFTGSPPLVNAGDNVTVIGTVQEFRPGGGTVNLSITEIAASGGAVIINSSGNSLPAPIVIGAGGRTPPTMVIEDDSWLNLENANVFDPGNDGIDFYESLEGMLVQVNNAVAVGPKNSNGEIAVLPDNGAGASVRTVRGGLIARANDFNPERVILDDDIVSGSMPAVNVGATLTTTIPITGVVDYGFGNFKLQVLSLPITATKGVSQETTAPPSPNQLAVATFNVENLAGTSSPSKFKTLASLIVDNLKSPDLLILEEIQDNNGTTDDGVVDATTTITKLISAITNAGGPTYVYRQIDPVNNQEGGQPGGNIRVVFLFRTDRGLSFVDRPCSGTCNLSITATYPELVGGTVQLHHSPGRVDPTNSAWTTPEPVRRPLAGEFMFNGNRLFVIGNHWKSKGGDDPLFGRYQPPTQYTQSQRNAEATVVKSFADSILALDPNAKIILGGDFNDFEFASPLLTLKGSTLHILIEDLPANERYSYNFDGNAQALDHLLVSNWLYANASPQLDIVHVNSEFATQASDHDPSVVKLTLKNMTTTALTSSPNPSTIGQLVTFTATVGVSPNGNRPQRLAPRNGCPITGSVDFKQGAVTLGTGTVNAACIATYSTSSLTMGQHPIVAVYSGDANYSPSTSSPYTLLVGAVKSYLPLVTYSGTPSPDLVVTSISATTNAIQLTIKNIGDRPVVDEFWVDVYINPATAPTRVNQTWEMVAAQGLVWGATTSALPLAPGQSLTLAINDSYYWPSLSNVTWPLTSGMPVYAQVDSANANTNYGAVLENHEIAKTSYNNITSTAVVTISAPVRLAPASVKQYPRDRGRLPAR